MVNAHLFQTSASRLLAVLIFSVLIALAGCVAESNSGTLDRKDAGERVVAVRMPSSLSTEPRSGISLGDGYVVTAAPWLDYPSFCCAKEAPSEARFEVSSPGHPYGEADLHGLEANRGWMLFRQPAGSLPPAVASGSLREGGRAYLLGVVRPDGAGNSEAVAVRETVGVVAETSVPLPGAEGSEAHILVRAPGWQGLTGGLVLDAQRRPAGLIRHFDTTTSGGLAYVVPLAEVQAWALR